MATVTSVKTTVYFTVSFQFANGQNFQGDFEIIAPIDSVEQSAFLQRYANYTEWQLRTQAGELGLIEPPLP